MESLTHQPVSAKPKRRPRTRPDCWRDDDARPNVEEEISAAYWELVSAVLGGDYSRLKGLDRQTSRDVQAEVLATIKRRRAERADRERVARSIIDDEPDEEPKLKPNLPAATPKHEVPQWCAVKEGDNRWVRDYKTKAAELIANGANEWIAQNLAKEFANKRRSKRRAKIADRVASKLKAEGKWEAVLDKLEADGKVTQWDDGEITDERKAKKVEKKPEKLRTATRPKRERGRVLKTDDFLMWLVEKRSAGQRIRGVLTLSLLLGMIDYWLGEGGTKTREKTIVEHKGHVFIRRRASRWAKRLKKTRQALMRLLSQLQQIDLIETVTSDDNKVYIRIPDERHEVDYQEWLASLKPYQTKKRQPLPSKGGATPPSDGVEVGDDD